LARTFKMGLVQMTCGFDREGNLGKARAMATRAAEAGASLICLQELFASLYFPQTIDASLYGLAESIPGPTTEFLSDLARNLGVILVGSLFEKARLGLGFNTAVVVDPSGEIIGKSRKNHIPEGVGYHEKYYFAPGDTGYPVLVTGLGRLAIGTCWDQWFPEVSRIYALNGAEVILYPTAIGTEPRGAQLNYQEPWEVNMRGQAVANQVFLGAVNRVGQEGDIRFFGSSFVADPLGRVLGRLGRDEEGVLVVDVDLEEITRARDAQHLFRDRRPETYGALLGL
jgi:N-carbamoylputrescine amidase